LLILFGDSAVAYRVLTPQAPMLFSIPDAGSLLAAVGSVLRTSKAA
jgi:hypothetical protein